MEVLERNYSQSSQWLTRWNLPDEHKVNLSWDLKVALLSKITLRIQRSETAVGSLGWIWWGSLVWLWAWGEEGTHRDLSGRSLEPPLEGTSVLAVTAWGGANVAPGWPGRRVSLTDMSPLINSLAIIAGLLEINLRFLCTFLFSFPDNLLCN